MSTGFAGAIDPGGEGDLSTHYAVAVTYRVQSGWVNKVAVACKRCGAALAKGEGTAVVVVSMRGQYPSSPFFCHPCVDWVTRSLTLVLDRQAKDAQMGPVVL